jgi:phage gp46-like protein
MAVCNESSPHRRRLFWATQPELCVPAFAPPKNLYTEECPQPPAPVANNCGFQCGRPGLQVQQMVCQDCDGATISTENWVRGLAINMLMTDGRAQDTSCGYRPGSQGGHWSESYMAGDSVGTLLRTIPPQGRVIEAQALLTAYAKATLERMVTRGVANRIEVTTAYLGDGRFQQDIEIYGTSYGDAKVGLAASRAVNEWVWQ